VLVAIVAGIVTAVWADQDSTHREAT